MKRIEIEFVISRQGVITSTVRNLKGSGCGRVSRELESGLGRVIEKSKTAEYFDRHGTVRLSLHQDIEKF